MRMTKKDMNQLFIVTSGLITFIYMIFIYMKGNVGAAVVNAGTSNDWFTFLFEYDIFTVPLLVLGFGWMLFIGYAFHEARS